MFCFFLLLFQSIHAVQTVGVSAIVAVTQPFHERVIVTPEQEQAFFDAIRSHDVVAVQQFLSAW